jgi:hypothetical protein
VLTCVLCESRAARPEHQVAFRCTERHEKRPPTRVQLEGRMCQTCAAALYKHLKRAIPRARFAAREV